jgi:hypothetical protein
MQAGCVWHGTTMTSFMVKTKRVHDHELHVHECSTMGQSDAGCRVVANLATTEREARERRRRTHISGRGERGAVTHSVPGQHAAIPTLLPWQPA